MRLSVPGNLLLAGEYLVLDEGGKGLAVAVEPRLSASAGPSSTGDWSIRAIMGKTSLSWPPGAGSAADPATGSGSGENLPLARTMMLACAEAFAARGKPMPEPLAIELDSSAFFSPEGRKAGFGSSAAAAVAIAMLTGRAAGLADAELVDFSAEAALAGHRAAQGGRGSGYDIFASLYGGCGIFTGGTKPGWKVLGPLPPRHAVLVPGPAAVRSSEAVEAFRCWLAGHPEEAVSILPGMRSGVRALVDATISGDTTSFRLALDQAGAAGRQLGEAIGYSAFIAPPSGFESLRVKALGAGNELGMMVLEDVMPGHQDSLPPGCLAFRPTGGPQWLS
jgi:phosphomevalonate kinase